MLLWNSWVDKVVSETNHNSPHGENMVGWSEGAIGNCVLNYNKLFLSYNCFWKILSKDDCFGTVAFNSLEYNSK